MFVSCSAIVRGKIAQYYFLALDLAFETRSIRTLCEKASQADRQLGTKVGRYLRAALADMQRASNVMDLPTAMPRSTNGYEMEISLSQGYKLFFAVNHSEIPVRRDESVNWKKVTRIKITRIGVSHG